MSITTKPRLKLTQVYDEQGRRFYRVGKSDNHLISVSTLANHYQPKFGLINWKKKVGEEEAKRITRESANRGTTLHAYAETGKIAPEHREQYSKFVNHYELLKQLVILEQKELAVYYRKDSTGFAGTLDALGSITLNSEVYRGIMDYKYKNKPINPKYIHAYALQLAGYTLAYNQRYAENLENAALLCMTEEKAQVFIFDQEHLDYYCEAMLEILDSFLVEDKFNWYQFTKDAPIIRPIELVGEESSLKVNQGTSINLSNHSA